MKCKGLLMLQLLFSLVLHSCTYNVEDEVHPEPSAECSENISYSISIQPIIAANCAVQGCHDISASGGYVFENYAGVKMAIENGRLLGAIKHESGFVPMPYNRTKLSACSIKKIETWINQGYKND